MKLWNDLRGWAGANAAALRLSFRMTVAGLLAYVLAKLFTLPQGYWAVFSAIIIMQASVGGSVKSTIDRVIGTIGGAVAGGTVGYLLPHESVVSRRRTRHRACAADVGGSAVAELSDRAADGRDRTVNTGRTTTRAAGLGALSHFRNHAWQFRRPRCLTCAVAGACAWAGDRRRCPHAGPSRRSARRLARSVRRQRGP